MAVAAERRKARYVLEIDNGSYSCSCCVVDGSLGKSYRDSGNLLYSIVLDHIFSANALFTPKVAMFTPSENHTKVIVQFPNNSNERGKSIKFHIKFSPSLSLL
jgi:hypothetical protein